MHSINMKRKLPRDNEEPNNKTICLTSPAGLPEGLISSPGWPTIISHLTMLDVKSLCDSHPLIKIMVVSQLKDRNRAKLVINDQMLNKYPVPEYTSLYRYYGKFATNVELNEVFYHELQLLLPLFPRAGNLTLRNIYVNWIIPDCAMKDRISKLSLINTEFEDHESMQSWLGSLSQLQSLYWETSDFASEMPRLPSLSQLKSLTLIRQNGIKWLNHYNFPRLTRLAVDSYGLYHPDHMYNPHYLNNLRLDELRIQQVVDPKYKSEIESLNIPKLDVHYFPIPTESEGTPILLLNEDCLWHLQHYLSGSDWLALRKTHPHFQEMKIRTEYLISKDSDSSELPTIGPLVSKLYISELSTEDDVIGILNHFPNLRELGIILDMKQTHNSNLANAIPRGLRNLCVYVDDASENPFENLKEFNCVHELLTDDYLVITPDVLQFLKNNQDTLKSIVLPGIKDIYDLETQFWKVLAKMPALEILELYKQENTSEAMPAMENARLKQLSTNCPETLSKIHSLPHLTHLNCGFIEEQVALDLVTHPRLISVYPRSVYISKKGAEKIRRELLRQNRKSPFPHGWNDYDEV